MPSMQIIDELDRCRRHSRCPSPKCSPAVNAPDLLIDNLDNAIGQVQAQLQQCTCQARPRDLDAPVPLHRGAITVYQRPRPVHPES